jgi:transposase
MLTLPSSVRVYLAAVPVDLRRGHDGLVGLVRNTWNLNPFEGHLFVFLGKRLDRVKILVWDRNGFVLYYKRLSRGRFRMPSVRAGATRIEMDATTLAMLLDGIDVERVRRPAAYARSSPKPTASTTQGRARGAVRIPGTSRRRVLKSPTPGAQMLARVAALGSGGTQSEWYDRSVPAHTRNLRKEAKSTATRATWWSLIRPPPSPASAPRCVGA